MLRSIPDLTAPEGCVTMTNGRKEKLSWAAPKLQRMSAKLAEMPAGTGGAEGVNTPRS